MALECCPTFATESGTLRYHLEATLPEKDGLEAAQRLRMIENSEDGGAMAPGRPILVVEDNPVNQLLIQKQLGILGFAATVASGGREALEHFETDDFALVLTDIQMPGMDGFALAVALRQLEREQARPATPIIALTANAFAEDVRRCLDAGMDDCLTKPATLDRIRDTLKKWLPKPLP